MSNAALEDHKTRWIPYRLRSVEILNLAMRLNERWDQAPPMEVRVKGKTVAEGNLSGLTNAWIESGVLHCRALLEFLGLKLKPNTVDRLAERKRKQRDSDVVIEDYNLPRVSVSDALSKYPGDSLEAEAALATPIAIANSFVAHSTVSILQDPNQAQLLRIGAMGVPALVISYFYTPLGLPPPEYKLPSRPREPLQGAVADDVKHNDQ